MNEIGLNPLPRNKWASPAPPASAAEFDITDTCTSGSLAHQHQALMALGDCAAAWSACQMAISQFRIWSHKHTQKSQRAQISQGATLNGDCMWTYVDLIRMSFLKLEHLGNSNPKHRSLHLRSFNASNGGPGMAPKLRQDSVRIQRFVPEMEDLRLPVPQSLQHRLGRVGPLQDLHAMV